MSPAIESGVAAKQLHSSWRDWTGDGEVAIAARIDGGPVVPRLYTFLPLGQAATAPFNGYLHGSFFPTSNRKAIDASVELNRLLLDKAASLAAMTVRWIAQLEDGGRERARLDLSAAATAAVDLLVWSKVASLEGEPGEGLAGRGGRIDLPATVARAIGSDVDTSHFANATVIPCSGGVASIAGAPSPIVWRTPREARYWISTSETFTVDCLAEHGRGLGITPLWPGLGEDRVRRLIAFLGTHAQGHFVEKPTLAERAQVAASLAATFPRGRKLSADQWSAFYRDLVSFMDGTSAPLAGHEIILCDDGTLRAGGSAKVAESLAILKPRRRRRRGEKVEASLFFPPAPRVTSDVHHNEDDGLRVPSQLKEYFAFVSNALAWHGPLKRAREFLEGGLVSSYDGETVLTRISQVVNNEPSTEETIAGLRWAFSIWRHAGGRLITNQRTYRLLVPTAHQTFIPATEAIFSETWPEETLGRRMNEFLQAAPPELPDVLDLKGRLMAPIGHRAFGKARIGEWTEFLTALGVRRGLVVIDKPATGQFRAADLTTFGFCQKIGIPQSVVKMWQADVGFAGTSFAYSTNYNFKGKVWWLPGQADHEHFSNECRELYAALVVDWIGQAPSDVFTVSVTHVHYSDTKTWSTPVGAFLRAAKWMPADDPSSAEKAIRGHFQPSNVWIAGQSSDRFPYYLRQPAVALAKALERAPHQSVDRLITRGHLRVLGRTDTLLQQVQFLANQYQLGTVSRHYEPQFLNLYNATWKTIADRHGADPGTFLKSSPPNLLVVRLGNELKVEECGVAGSSTIYVRDSDDEIAPSLINAIAGLIVDVKGADRDRVGAVFEALYGKRISRISTIQYDVRADGMPIDTIPLEPLAVNVFPWLRPMVAVSIEALKGTDASRLPADRSSLLVKLAYVGLHLAKDVTFELNGIKLPSDGQRKAYLFKRADGSPIVVVLHTHLADWSTLEECLPPICDAIDLPSIAMSMRVLAHKLETSATELGATQIDLESFEWLCNALYLDEQASTAARYLVSERLGTRLPWVRAVVHLLGGTPALEQFRAVEVSSRGDVDLLRAALAALLASTELAPDDVLDACRRSFTTEQFRERMQLEFAAFNASLIASGGEAETYPELHTSQLVSYVAENEIEIIEALRNAAAPSLDNYRAAPEYIHRRDSIRTIPPEPAWLLLYKTVPEELVAARVVTWLAESGAGPPGTNTSALPALQAVRKVNAAAIAEFAAVAGPLIRTWCGARGINAPEIWSDPQASEGRLRAALEAAGIVDFRELNESALLAWCTSLNLWPVKMNSTLDRVALGIESTDIEMADKKARDDAERREAKDRSVPVNGQDEDPLNADWTRISDVIAMNLSQRSKATVLGAFTELAPVEKSAADKSQKTQRKTSNPTIRVPQSKKDMIGRLGELVVYHWLRERLPNQDIDKAWVSKNGTAQTGRPGSDEHGYDFEVEYRKQTWQIEVKASLGDQQRFEMGETEVRAAREAARPRSKTRYVVVYVANPHDPKNTVIDVLPNPMSAEADGVLDLLGEGVRFGFKRL